MYPLAISYRSRSDIKNSRLDTQTHIKGNLIIPCEEDEIQ